MKKLYFFTIWLCIFAESSYGQQNNLRDIARYNSRKEVIVHKSDNTKFQEQISRFHELVGIYSEPIRKVEIRTLEKDKSIKEISDFVLYREVVRKHTWLEGLGDPITQEEANHLPYYYRLSMRNDVGHYQLVEAMHGNSLTTFHPISTYILDKESDKNSKNKEWRERLQTVGQWMFYSDLSGENVVEERAYEAKEKNAKLVYSMQPVLNDSNHVTITYSDSYGYPADMDEDSRFTYGSVVYITYDENGYDAVIDYLDGEGYRKPNTNGVDQTRCEYDENGRPLLRTSNNCVDDYAIDNWGNCGIKYTYDDANNSYSMLCVDSNLQPMRMPNIRATEEETYIRCDVKKDRWGRKSEAVMLTAEGEKDATLSGIHRITYAYKADGTQQRHYYDISGKEITIE